MLKIFYRMATYFAKLFDKNSLAQESNSASGEKYITDSMPEICRKAGAESIVLLKNDGVLPFKQNDTVSVFGRCQIDTFYVGYGSGGDVHPPYKVNYIDALLQAEKNGAIKLNHGLLDVYRKWTVKHKPIDGFWGHWPMNYDEMPVKAKFAKECAKNSNVAVVIIGRAAGEDRENKLTKGSYYLTNTERKLLDSVTSAFAKTVVVMDCGNIVDMAWTKDYGDKISAILYAWQGGMESGNSLADVLTGKVNPCGKLPDTISVNYSDQPTAKNFCGKKFNNYSEDIFVGYRYFETFAKDKVLYPFGFGLSYTNFKIECLAFDYNNGKVTVKAKVTNAGAVAGKEVLQLYIKSPQGKLGKASRSLVAFEKSKLLAHGESQTITLICDDYAMASYDDSGVTGNKHAYILESGEYEFFLGNSVRTELSCGKFTLDKEKIIKKLQGVCGIQNPFDRLQAKEQSGKTVAEYRQTPKIDYDLKQRILENLPTDVGYKGDKGYKLSDVASGKITLDEFVSQLTNEELEALSRGHGSMNSDLGTKGNAGAYGGIIQSLRQKGVEPIITNDGPAGIRISSYTALLPCGTALAATWDTDLVQSLYALVGREMTHYKTDLILGAGMNIHRNPLCGRNFEYFSEDPLLSGKTAAAFVNGIQSQGKGACPKHFACNNQETKRNTNDSRVSERALREIYLKGFEICIRDSKPIAIMSSYNKLNGVWNHYNYDLITTVLRGEWGYDGTVITDWWIQKSQSPEFPNMKDNGYRVRAQVDVLMPGNMKKFKEGYISDGTLLSTFGQKDGITRGELERSAKNVLNNVIALKIKNLDNGGRQNAKRQNVERTDI